MKRRILHVVHWLNRGGIETWLLELLRYAHSVSIAMDVCCKGPTTGELAESARQEGANVLHCPAGGLGYFTGRYSRQLAALIHAGEYDVVHSHLGDLSGPVLTAARIAGVPGRLVTYHQAEHRLEHHRWASRPFQRWQRSVRPRLLREATQIFGCSQAVLDAVFPGDSDRRLGVHYPSINVRRFTPRERPPAMGRPLQVVNVGNLGYAKNQQAIIQVATRTRAMGVEATYTIAGEGPLRSELEELIRRADLEDVVQLVGRCQDVPELLRAADLAIHPSVTEGLPVAVLEYQAVELPLIASTVSAVAEAVAPSNRPFLCAPDDVDAMAQNVARLARNEQMRRDAGTSGRAWVAQRFSIEAASQPLFAAYGISPEMVS